MSWRITFYSEKVELETLNLPPGILADFLRVTELIEEFGPMSKRPTMARFRDKALKDPKVREEYDALSPAFDLKRQMIALRKAAGLTQAEMAELLGTKRSNISRLESVSSGNSPRLDTISEYARVLGYQVKVEFQPAVE